MAGTRRRNALCRIELKLKGRDFLTDRGKGDACCDRPYCLVQNSVISVTCPPSFLQRRRPLRRLPVYNAGSARNTLSNCTGRPYLVSDFFCLLIAALYDSFSALKFLQRCHHLSRGAQVSRSSLQLVLVPWISQALSMVRSPTMAWTLTKTTTLISKPALNMTENKRRLHRTSQPLASVYSTRRLLFFSSFSVAAYCGKRSHAM